MRVFAKIVEGIRKQTNQAIARHRLMTGLDQGKKNFATWYPTVKEQAKHCSFDGYGVDEATRDAFLFQTSSPKLKQKILAENLNLDNTIKFGLAYKQSRKTAESLRTTAVSADSGDRVAALEEDVRRLISKQKGSSKCDTCTFPTHATG